MAQSWGLGAVRSWGYWVESPSPEMEDCTLKKEDGYYHVGGSEIQGRVPHKARSMPRGCPRMVPTRWTR